MQDLLRGLKVLHVELTTGCNLRCPQCPRTEGELPNDFLVHGELSLEDFKRILPPEVIANMERIFMCGNYGEPAYAKDCLEIMRYIKSANPNITLGMNTNGSLRNEKWWAEVASILTGLTDYVVFSIDGLEDTNHIYRRDSNWNKIMKNAASYINNGGAALWDYLVFEHNKHQIEEAQALAKSMGFRSFQCKESHRKVHHTVSWLKKVSEPFANTPIISDEVSCDSLNSKALFLNAKGEYYPCCYIGSMPDLRHDAGLRGIPAEEVTRRTFEELNNGKPNEVCRKFCSVMKDGQPRVRSQWTKMIIFNPN